MYKTKDLNIAAALMSEGFKFSGVEDNGQGRRELYFLFEANPSEVEKLVLDYMNGDLMVNLKAFTDCLKTLKDYIFSK